MYFQEALLDSVFVELALDTAISYLSFLSPCEDTCSFVVAASLRIISSSAFVSFGHLPMRVGGVWMGIYLSFPSFLGLIVDLVAIYVGW